jgi:hypothetical protein
MEESPDSIEYHTVRNDGYQRKLVTESAAENKPPRTSFEVRVKT